MWLTFSTVLVLAGITGIAASGAEQSGPASESTASRAETFDHTAWTKVLQQFVDERGLVDYQALSRDPGDLDRYLRSIATRGPKTTPELFSGDQHQLAYYLNAYNALVFEGVLARGPETTSVWRGGLISGYAFFVKQKFTVDGQRTGLKKFEDDIVRRRFGDPRVHAALNCASLGCPRLPRVAFEAKTLDAQLDREMRLFVSEPRNVRPDPETQRVYLSKIFDWFEKDFLDWQRSQGSAKPSLIDYVNRYRNEAIPTDYKVLFLDYDKSLNQQSTD